MSQSQRPAWQSRIAVILAALGLFIQCGSGATAPTVSAGNASGNGGSAATGAGAGAGGTNAVAMGGMLGVSGAAGTPSQSGSGGAAASGGGSGGATGGSGGGDAGTTGASGGVAGGGGSAFAGAAGTTGQAASGGAGGTSQSIRKAFMVVLPTAMPTAGDNVMAGRLRVHGFQVTFVSDKTVNAQTVTGADLVVISSSAESGNLGVRLRDIASPIFCVENGQYPNQGMTPTGKGTGEDSVFTQTAVAIIAQASPLAGGLSGSVTISNKAGELGWGAPPATVMNVATVVGQANHSAIFGFAKGDQMVGMTAPAKRAGFAIREDLAANLSPDGIKLFDAIVAWVTE